MKMLLKSMKMTSSSKQNREKTYNTEKKLVF